MRHYLLTRSAYGSAWTVDANERRLAITRGITIPSVACQSGVRWIVALHRDDPMLAERRCAYQSSGVPVSFLYVDSPSLKPATVAFEAYNAEWREAIGRRDEAVAMTRLDDDDALAPDAFARLRERFAGLRQRTALVFPCGIRVWAGRYTRVVHRSNAMQTLVTMPGDITTVYDYGHRYVSRAATVRNVDRQPGWLWFRHPDVISGWKMAEEPIDGWVRGLFPIDWSLVGDPVGAPARGGRRFQ